MNIVAWFMIFLLLLLMGLDAVGLYDFGFGPR